MVTPDVLIPRPETELMMEQAIAWAKDRPLKVVDVGAGSGVLALTLAKHLPQAQVTGIDISEAALELARHNANYLKLDDRVRWLHGPLLEPLIALGEGADLIVANLPYIPSPDMASLEVSRHEPHLALDGGPDGLQIIRDFLALAPQVISPSGLILMEIGSGQGAAVQALAQASFPDRHVSLSYDLAGHDRFIRIEAP
jgi:release factor glutamine methyltransferase